MTAQIQPTVTIADRSHAPAIMTLINDAFRPVESFFLDQERINLAEVLELFDRGSFLIVETGDSLNGAIYLEPRGDRMYFGLLSVDPTLQSAGLGSFLVTAAEDHARAQGSTFMDIVMVNRREDLRGFYKKRGYVETGTSPFPPEAKLKLPCFFINMSKAL